MEHAVVASSAVLNLCATLKSNTGERNERLNLQGCGHLHSQPVLARVVHLSGQHLPAVNLCATLKSNTGERNERLNLQGCGHLQSIHSFLPLKMSLRGCLRPGPDISLVCRPNRDFHFGSGTATVYTCAAPNTTSFRAEPCTSPPPVGAAPGFLKTAGSKPMFQIVSSTEVRSGSVPWTAV